MVKITAYKLLIIIFAGIALLSCKKNLNNNFIGSNDITYKVYYFHPTARCESCINIENFTKELITTKYTTPVSMKYEALNIEEPQNEHYKNDFGLKFSSVVIAKYNKGNVEKFKNLDSIWSYSDNKFGFFRYADKEIMEFIK